MNYIRLFDRVFSTYIRMKYADENGNVKCCTCPKIDHWKHMQAGHYISRTWMYLRFDERNVHPQCPTCNEFLQGNSMEYGAYIIEKYGAEGIWDLGFDKHKEWKKTKVEIKDMIKEYKQKIREFN